MKVAVFSTQPYETAYLTVANQEKHELTLHPVPLSLETTLLAKGCDVVSCFVTDDLSEPVITALAINGIQMIALRSAGFDHVDLLACQKEKITVTRAPNYSPEAVAEFAVALILALNRRLIISYQHSLKNDYRLTDLMGCNLYHKTVGIIGTGNIGTAFAKIMRGFGCRVIACDPIISNVCLEMGVTYLPLDGVLRQSDILSLHCPLNSATHHLLNKNAFDKMKRNILVINTGRGGLIDNDALLDALSTKIVRYAGLDVYEGENKIFFKNHGETPIDDPAFLQLRSMPNVMITPHHAFLTEEAITNIANTTIENISAFAKGQPINQVECK